MAKPGLYANIHAKRKRIKAGSGEKMRQVGSQGAPTQQSFIDSAKTAKRAGGGMMDIDRMTAPLGYDNGGDVDLAAIMADMKASRGPAKVTHPIQKIISDRSLIDPYSVSQGERLKELGSKGLEGIKGLGSKSLGALKYTVEELIGAGAAEGANSYISIGEAQDMSTEDLEKEIYGFNPYEFGSSGYKGKNLRTIQIVLDELMSRLEED